MNIAANFDREKFRDMKVKIRNTYYYSGSREAQIAEHIDYILENVDDFWGGAASPERCILVTGPAGTGKTWTLRELLNNVPEFQPGVRDGVPTMPLLRVVAPKQCATKDLLITLIKGYEHPAEGNERELTELLFSLVEDRTTICIHIDEFQHAFRTKSKTVIEAVQDLVKTLIDYKSWPIHLILSGMPRIRKLTQEGQNLRRSKLVTFDAMQCPEDAEWVLKCLRDIAVEGCGLTLSEELETDEFLARLCHAADGAWGTLIVRIQAVCFHCVKRQRKVLTIKDFAREYENKSGCLKDENIFLSPNWEALTSWWADEED